MKDTEVDYISASKDASISLDYFCVYKNNESSLQTTRKFV